MTDKNQDNSSSKPKPQITLPKVDPAKTISYREDARVHKKQKN